MKKALVIALLLIVGSAALAQDDEGIRSRYWHRHDSDVAKKARVAAIQSLVLAAPGIGAARGEVSVLDTAALTLLVARLDAGGFVTGSPDRHNSWRLIRQEASILGSGIHCSRYAQLYRGTEVFGGCVNLDLVKEDDGRWGFMSLSACTASIHTTITADDAMRVPSALAKAEGYFARKYVLAARPESSEEPDLVLCWMFDHREGGGWRLAYQTVHSYWVEVEGGGQWPIGLAMDAVTGEPMEEIPRAISCFGPAPRLKRPGK